MLYAGRETIPVIVGKRRSLFATYDDFFLLIEHRLLILLTAEDSLANSINISRRLLSSAMEEKTKNLTSFLATSSQNHFSRYVSIIFSL
jgi:hypothetical protein